MEVVGDMTVLGDWIVLEPDRMYVIPEKDSGGNPIRMIGVKTGVYSGGFVQDRVVLFNHTEYKASIKWIAAYGLDDEEPEWFKEMAYHHEKDWRDSIEWYRWTKIS